LLLWSELAFDLRPLVLPPRASPRLLVRALALPVGIDVGCTTARGSSGQSVNVVPISIFFLFLDGGVDDHLDAADYARVSSERFCGRMGGGGNLVGADGG
jgi:hypothetical protein